MKALCCRIKIDSFEVTSVDKSECKTVTSDELKRTPASFISTEYISSTTTPLFNKNTYK